MKFTKIGAIGALAGILLTAGCTAPRLDGGNYVKPLHGALVTDNPTAYSPALACVRGLIPADKRSAVAFAVGQIADATGKNEYYTGKPITQGGALMVMSALQKAGMRQVERFDTAVAELELQYANNKLISDPRTGYRQILAGSVSGSDFFIVGGITELNFNIHSSSADILVGPVDIGGRFFVMNVGADLRLVNSRSLEVVDVVSFQRQIMGREITAGVFEFIGSHPIDIGVGERSQEPVHRGVRAVLERAIIELVTGLYEVDGEACLPSLDASDKAADETVAMTETEAGTATTVAFDTETTTETAVVTETETTTEAAAAADVQVEVDDEANAAAEAAAEPA